MKNILIGCEESQKVCQAFRKLGYNAISCDIKQTRGNPDYHIQDDVFNVVPEKQWDLIILHPPCTHLSLSGNRWYGKGMPLHNLRLDAIDWTLRLWHLALKHSHKVALENPTSVIFNYFNNVQYIQPYQFGHGELKKTGFALHNLPPLKQTNLVLGRVPRIHHMPPSPLRQTLRSETYQGVADAIAQQWGILL